MQNPYLPSRVNGGRAFEKWIFGQDNFFVKVSDHKSDFEEVTIGSVLQKLKNSKNRCRYPDTLVSNVLYHHILRSLKDVGVQIDFAILVRTMGTLADAFYQSDAVFLVKTIRGHYLIATIDAAFFGGYQDKKAVKADDQKYLEIQDELYQIKRSNASEKGQPNWLEERPGNHFILSPKDLGRRGLKRLGRLIARALLEQERLKSHNTRQ
ncbi:MAG: hypothetical protein AAB392_01910 [Patescibacteria group bacterium]